MAEDKKKQPKYKSATGFSLMAMVEDIKKHEPDISDKDAMEMAKDIAAEVEAERVLKKARAGAKAKQQVVKKTVGKKAGQKIKPVSKEQKEKVAAATVQATKPETTEKVQAVGEQISLQLTDVTKTVEKLAETTKKVEKTTKDIKTTQKSQVYAEAAAALASWGKFTPAEIRQRLAGLETSTQSVEQVLKTAFARNVPQKAVKIAKQQVVAETAKVRKEVAAVPKPEKDASVETDIAQQESQETTKKLKKRKKEQEESDWKKHVMAVLDDIDKNVLRDLKKHRGSIFSLIGGLLGRTAAYIIGKILKAVLFVPKMILKGIWKAVKWGVGMVLTDIKDFIRYILPEVIPKILRAVFSEVGFITAWATTAAKAIWDYMSGHQQQHVQNTLDAFWAKYGVKITKRDSYGHPEEYDINGKKYTNDNLPKPYQTLKDSIELDQSGDIMAARSFSGRQAEAEIAKHPEIYKKLEIAKPAEAPAPTLKGDIEKAANYGYDKLVPQGMRDDLEKIKDLLESLLDKPATPPVIQNNNIVAPQPDPGTPVIDVRNGEPTVSGFMSSLFEHPVAAPNSNF